MKLETQPNSEMKQLAELIKSVGVGMLTTPSDVETMHSRPMEVLKMDQEGSLWFFTDVSADTKEAGRASMNIAFADVAHRTYVSIAGSSQIVFDPAIIEELWSPTMKAWFPGGKSDQQLALLKIDIESAEYWDSPGSKMIRIAALAVSAVSGEAVGLGNNETVSNRSGG